MVIVCLWQPHIVETVAWKGRNRAILCKNCPNLCDLNFPCFSPSSDIFKHLLILHSFIKNPLWNKLILTMFSLAVSQLESLFQNYHLQTKNMPTKTKISLKLSLENLIINTYWKTFDLSKGSAEHVLSPLCFLNSCGVVFLTSAVFP